MKQKFKPIDWDRLPATLRCAATTLRPDTSYSKALAMRNVGIITELQWRWFALFWVWSEVRFSNVLGADARQEKCFQALGYQGLMRRFRRVRRLHVKMWEHNFSAYFLVDEPETASAAHMPSPPQRGVTCRAAKFACASM